MSLKLIETLEKALADKVQDFPRDASVLIQFAAGDWAAIKADLLDARAEYDANQAALAAIPVSEPVIEPVVADVPVSEPDVSAEIQPVPTIPQTIEGVKNVFRK